jgi:hypothetical protein
VIKNQKGSILIALLTFVACVSAFFAMDFMYEKEDTEDFYIETDWYDRDRLEKIA